LGQTIHQATFSELFGILAKRVARHEVSYDACLENQDEERRIFKLQNDTTGNLQVVMSPKQEQRVLDQSLDIVFFL